MRIVPLLLFQHAFAGLLGVAVLVSPSVVAAAPGRAAATEPPTYLLDADQTFRPRLTPPPAPDPTRSRPSSTSLSRSTMPAPTTSTGGSCIGTGAPPSARGSTSSWTRLPPTIWTPCVP